VNKLHRKFYPSGDSKMFCADILKIKCWPHVGLTRLSLLGTLYPMARGTLSPMRRGILSPARARNGKAQISIILRMCTVRSCQKDFSVLRTSKRQEGLQGNARGVRDVFMLTQVTIKAMPGEKTPGSLSNRHVA